MVLLLFDGTEWCAKDTIQDPLVHVMKQTCVKALSTKEADHLPHDRVYKFLKAPNITQGLLRRLIRTFTFNVPVTHFKTQQARSTVASEELFKQDKILNSLLRRKSHFPRRRLVALPIPLAHPGRLIGKKEGQGFFAPPFRVSIILEVRLRPTLGRLSKLQSYQRTP